MPVDPTGLDELKGYLSCLKIKCPQVRAAWKLNSWNMQQLKFKPDCEI
jgi:hypothetical protein